MAVTRPSADVHPVLVAEAEQATGVALADGAEFPFTVTAVNFAENHCCFRAVVFGKVKTQHFLAAFVVHQADEGVADLAEVLVACFGVVDGDGDKERADVRRDFVELDEDAFVIAIAVAGEVVPVLLPGAFRGLGRFVEMK